MFMTTLPMLMLGFALSGYPDPPNGFIRESIGDNWTNPVGVVDRFDGHHVVWEREGKVWLVDPDGHVHDEPWLDLSDEVGAWRDHGMLGFALHPAFKQTGWIYVYYVVDRHHLLHAGTPDYDPDQNDYFSATIGRITRYTARAEDGFETIDPESRLVLLGETAQTGPPILYESHGVGSLVFGQDGTLLFSMGDSGSYASVDIGGQFDGSYVDTALEDGILKAHENIGAYRAQSIDSLCGKILRVDPLTGDGVSSNPWFNQANPRSTRSRVWSLGYRNPYRFTLIPESGSHDPEAGDPGTLLVGDVGWYLKEELTEVQTGGLNGGWPFYEGLDRTPGYSEATVPGNPSAPNPLANTKSCDPFFNFENLMLQDTMQIDPPFLNPCTVLEAEDTNYSGLVFSSEQYGHLGTGYLDFQNDSDDFIRWTVSIPKDGAYVLHFRYALGPSSSRPLRVEVDGITMIESLDFPSTGSFGEWRLLPISVDLTAGTRTISLHAIGSSGANFDCLAVEDGSSDGLVEVPADIPVFLHHRPIFDSHHGQNLVYFASYVDGAATNLLMGSSDSNVTGSPFPAFCTIAGPFLGTRHDENEGFLHDEWPEDWSGAFFADYQYRYIRVLTYDDSGSMDSFRRFDTNIGSIVNLARSSAGDALFAVTWEDGIFRYEWAPEENQAPVAAVETSIPYGPSPLSVTLDASNSSDPEGRTLVHTWDFGDGSPTETGMIVEHVFNSTTTGPEPIHVTLTVEDAEGLSDTANAVISLNNTPPIVQITSPLDGSLYSMSEVSMIDLEATIWDSEHSSDDLVCTWTSRLHHNTHSHSEPSDPNCSSVVLITPLGCGAENYWYEFELQVTDPAGLITTATSRMDPDCGSESGCPADLNRDGIVNGGDIIILLGNWNTPDSDINGDDLTDGQDLTIMLGSWGACS
jgi:glucose/arabinose dehydrogenase